MKEDETGRYADGMKETLDFIKKSEQIDLLNEGTVSLHVPRVRRIIRLKLGARTTGLKDTKTRRQNGVRMEMKPLQHCNDTSDIHLMRIP